MTLDLKRYSLDITGSAAHQTNIVLVDQNDVKKLTKGCRRIRRWLQVNGFEAKTGQVIAVPDAKGNIRNFYAAVSDSDKPDRHEFAAIRSKLPAGRYKVTSFMGKDTSELALAWALDAYNFKAGHDGKPSQKRILTLDEDTAGEVALKAEAIYAARDLINMPANQMTTDALAKAADDLMRDASLSTKFNIQSRILKGTDLIREDYPLIHTVGRASDNEPQLFDAIWGDPSHPKVTLVGKGVTFDTGGLGIKPGGSMCDMKKDMGGAAHVLALAKLIIAAELPVRLRVMIPIAENSISGNAYRPGDVMISRADKNGKRVTIENEHTDAEGRLIMADCLIEAASEEPDLLVDFATLTGAQRVAHGLEIGGIMGTDKQMLRDLEDIGEDVSDWLASLPLHKRYKKDLASDVADLKQSGGTAGAITAGLFLEHFTKGAKKWVHFDVSGWNGASRPARPRGGEVLGVRSLYEWMKKEYPAPDMK